MQGVVGGGLLVEMALPAETHPPLTPPWTQGGGLRPPGLISRLKVLRRRHGPDRDTRRQAAQGQDSDLGRQERRFDPAALRPADRRAADPPEPAAAGRRRQLRPFTQPARRLYHDRG